MKVHIIGCGSIGSRVAIKIYESLSIRELNLYDDDLVTKEDLPIFWKNDIGLSKLTVLENILIYKSSLFKPKIYTLYTYLLQDIDLDENIVIDCRDKKTQDVNAHIKISCDKGFLYIDSSQIRNLYENAITDYSDERNNLYFNLAAEIVVNFINNRCWLDRKFHFYNLSEFIKGKEININGKYL
jgi:hypothetical protein